MNRSAVSFFEKVSNGLLSAEAYSEPSPTSKKELFTKIVNRLKPRKFFAKNFIIDFW